MSEDSFRKLYKQLETPAPSAQLMKDILDFAKNEVNSGTGIEASSKKDVANVVSITTKKKKSRFWYMPATIAAGVAGVFAISVVFVYLSPKYKGDAEWVEIPIRGESKSDIQKREELQRKKLEEERKRAQESVGKSREEGKL